MSRPSFRERFRYKSDQFFQSGFTLQLTISAAIILAVVSFFYMIAEVAAIQPGSDFDVEPGAGDPFWPSVRFWWVLTHVLESYWIERTTLPQILSLFMTLFNLLVFAALIGLFGTKIQQRLEQVRRGTSRVMERGHIVILGWSGKVVPVMRELGEGLEDDNPIFVLHSERPIDEIDARLKRAFSGKQRRGRVSARWKKEDEAAWARLRRRIRWVIRRGSLADMRDLELLNIPEARAVIILNQNGDAQVIKSIMAIAHLIDEASEGGDGRGEARPVSLIIAEITDPGKQRLARAAARGMDISIIQPAEYLSRIILQTARQRGLVHVYDELLSHSGNELHFTAPGDVQGLTWPELLEAFPDATPVGMVIDGAPLLAPSGEDVTRVLGAADAAICIARDDQAMQLRTVPSGREEEARPALRRRASTRAPSVRRLLILGWNDEAAPLLKEYAAYADTLGQAFEATLLSPAVPAYFDAAELCCEAISLMVIREDALVEGVLDRVHPADFDAIIVLGELRGRGSVEDADTNVIMQLLLLRSMREEALRRGEPYPEEQQIVTEILDLANKDLADSTGTARDVIISNDLVSKMIAQVCRDRRTEFVLRDIFDEAGKEVYIKPALWYSEAGSRLTVAELRRLVYLRDEALIGVRAATAEGTGITLNPDPTSTCVIDENLALIVIAEHEGGWEMPD